MKMRFVGGPLAGRKLVTAPGSWFGDWLTTADQDWALYALVYRDPATGIVLAEAGSTSPVDGSPRRKR